MRTILIGDIHGCAAEFRSLVGKLDLNTSDKIVLLGDLIDKGPSPAEVVAFAREIGATTILGNHEEKALRWLKHEAKRKATGKNNPMNVSAEHAEQWSSLSADDVSYLESAPWFKDLGNNFLAVHGGLTPGVPLDQQKPNNVLRLRYVTAEGKFAGLDANLNKPAGVDEWQARYDGPNSLVVGHAVHSLDQPRIDTFEDGREIWNIDTGCVHGGHLTALVLETKEVIQVKAAQVYAPQHEE